MFVENKESTLKKETNKQKIIINNNCYPSAKWKETRPNPKLTLPHCFSFRLDPQLFCLGFSELLTILSLDLFRLTIYSYIYIIHIHGGIVVKGREAKTNRHIPTHTYAQTNAFVCLELFYLFIDQFCLLRLQFVVFCIFFQCILEKCPDLILVVALHPLISTVHTWSTNGDSGECFLT